MSSFIVNSSIEAFIGLNETKLRTSGRSIQAAGIPQFIIWWSIDVEDNRKIISFVEYTLDTRMYV